MKNLVKKITIVMLIGVVFSLTGLAQAAEKNLCSDADLHNRTLCSWWNPC